MKTLWMKRLAALFALSAVAGGTACTSIEPMTGPADAPELWGDKTWAFVHPWYNRSWSTGGKTLYWVGPGH